MKSNLLLILLLCVANSVFSQQFSGEVKWGEKFRTEQSAGGKTIIIWPCTDCLYGDENPGLPFKSLTIPVPSYGKMSCHIISAKWEPVNIASEYTPLLQMPENYTLQSNVGGTRGKYSAFVSIPTVRKNASGSWERLLSYTLEATFTPTISVQTRNGWTTTSALSTGDNYKVAVGADGIYKLDYNFFKNTLGIDPNTINPRHVKIFGNPGGMLPEASSIDRPDDLIENAIYFSGEDDEKFDAGDYILFYASGANEKKYNEKTKLLNLVTNLYSAKNYYFIQISGGNGKRISQSIYNANPAFWTNKFLDVKRVEDEKFNLLNSFEYAQGSGRRWFGDAFSASTEKKYDSQFVFDDIILTDTVFMYAEFAARSSEFTKFTMTILGKQVNSSQISNTDLGDVEAYYARYGNVNYKFLPTQSQINTSVKFIAGNNSTGWLDYIEMNAYRKLNMASSPLFFQDPNTLQYPEAGYEISNAKPNLWVWNISTPGNVVKENVTISNNTARFSRQVNGLERFVSFYPDGNYNTPEYVSKIENQNLHGIEQTNMVILYEKSFEQQVMKLKSHRESKSGLKISLVRIDQLYNEFSSGRQDISAIRDFSRMLYSRTPDYKYLLLFGDASFDYKNNLNNQPHLNFIPVFETEESLNPVYSYPTDDFFGLLDPEEGKDLKGVIDISIGRMPVNNAEQAETAINKIIQYDTNPDGMRDWRNRIVFSADDEDQNMHLDDTEGIAKKITVTHPVYNQNKIYLDAFQQVATPGGDRIPEANNAINNDIFKGSLVYCYLGHGGPKGLAQERVVNISDINSWTNFDRLALFITATCTFTGFDDPSIYSGGEQTFNNPKGGAIALLTTTRAVYAISNAALVRTVYDSLFQKTNCANPRLGDVCRSSKDNFAFSPNLSNARKFLLVGDPSIQIAIPSGNVETTKINGHLTKSGVGDTLSALQKVSIEGRVLSCSGQLLDDFNGKLYVTIFDKAKDYKTLAQDKGSVVTSFSLQKNVIFKGVASVEKGLFSFSFVVPKDIDYKYGLGKISYYAENGTDLDAAGYYDKIVIGGTATNPISDDTPPVVNVFLNDENFVKGGITEANPVLLAKISDDLGINITGSSIGHDLTAVIDENTQGEIILNDFFESELNNPAKGTVRYPLKDIAPGVHTLKVKAWDISNKSGEGTTEFTVAENGVLALAHVLNYPNPFTSSTSFQFEHNFGNKNLHVRISIYSVSGSLVKTIHQDIQATGSRITGINWDGKDDYGNGLARGVYIYKVKISETEGGVAGKKAESDYEKLVILK
ncbi:MAG TPA: type IX secretion system sortase PorU [Saprospiraceae bacterium]|nr:type IX secretion system sortase PorU [Saprospiraceae bacterium]